MSNMPAEKQLRQLIDDHYQVVYRYAYRMSGQVSDAEDLVQQTFMTAQRKLDQLKDVDRARSWLLSIVRNHFLRTLRGGPGDPVASIDAVPEIEADPSSAGARAASGTVDDEALQRELNALPEEYRTPIILFYFEELSYKEIAQQMDIPMGTVMSRLARGKSALHEGLAAHHPEWLETDSDAVSSKAAKP